MNTYRRLDQLEIEPAKTGVSRPNFVMTVQSGNLVFLSEHIARKAGKPWGGQLGSMTTGEEGKAAARSVAVDLLSTLHAQLGDLDRIVRFVKVLCLANSMAAITEQHLVANGCSELLVDVFAEKGRHARSAVGPAQLPFGVCVEIEMIAEVR